MPIFDKVQLRILSWISAKKPSQLKCLAVILTTSWLLLVATQVWLYRDRSDFLQIHLALRAVVSGESPYSATFREMLQSSWPPSIEHHAVPVVAYPPPSLVALAPLGFLSLDVSIFLFTVASVALLVSAFYEKRLAWLPPYVCVFYPLIHAYRIANPTIFFFGIAAALVRYAATLPGWLVGVGCGLLLLKPQAGLLFAVGILIFLRGKRAAAIAGFIATILTLIILTQLLLPGEWMLWRDAVSEYASRTKSAWLIMFSPLLVLTIGLPWPVFLSIAQVLAFPVNDIYSTLPILVAWRYFDPRLALLGCSVSLIPLVSGLNPNSGIPLLCFQLMPLFAVCLLFQLRGRNSSMLRE